MRGLFTLLCMTSCAPEGPLHRRLAAKGKALGLHGPRQGRPLGHLSLLVSGVLLASASLASVPMPALAVGTLDQSQDVATTGLSVDTDYSIAQTFTAGVTGWLDRVSIAVGATPDLSENLTVEIGDTTGGVPVAGVLASETIALNVTPEDGLVRLEIDFSSPAWVMAGTTYAIVVPVTSVGSVGVGGQDLGSYAGGNGYWQYLATGWNLYDAVDFAFRTYVTSAAPPNDERVNALAIDLPYSTSIDTTAATVDADDPTCYEATPLGASVWYSFRPTWSGSLAIEAVLSNYFVGVAVFHGSDMLECRPSSSGAFVEGIVANETYHVVFFDTEPSDGIGGTLDFRMMRSVQELIVSVNVDSAVITAPGELTISGTTTVSSGTIASSELYLAASQRSGRTMTSGVDTTLKSRPRVDGCRPV